VCHGVRGDGWCAGNENIITASFGTYFSHVVEKFEQKKWGKEEDLVPKKEERKRRKIRIERVTHEKCIFGCLTPIRARERKRKLSLTGASKINKMDHPTIIKFNAHVLSPIL
jgi:hypothetical protein